MPWETHTGVSLSDHNNKIVANKDWYCPRCATCSQVSTHWYNSWEAVSFITGMYYSTKRKIYCYMCRKDTCPTPATYDDSFYTQYWQSGEDRPTMLIPYHICDSCHIYQ